ncbi:hypothetical protein RvY_09933 [Ramazzottius varieornatus]|uniref:Transporter n=1 Tax=Ramazzottius varieornatus TaxID=947166 RepID=A0A1D1VB16_RAMVA|nr:hypothetical protein RvY_09933 [Ramazzottius varieornatus]
MTKQTIIITREATIATSNGTVVTPGEDPVRAPVDGSDRTNGDAGRAQWGNKVEFLLSCISLSVGLGNVWRFPYLAYANGGGAFLLPYIVVLFLVGKPMYFMEIAAGQYHAKSPVPIWKRIAPIAKGIGMAQIVISFCVAVYYAVIMSWVMYYFWATLVAACQGKAVPWENFCENDWAYNKTCFSTSTYVERPNYTFVPVVNFDNNETESERKVSSAQQYYDRFVMMKYEKASPNIFTITNLGDVNLLMLASLAGCWLVIYVSLVKGVQSSGKVVYVTSTMPFIVLFILLIRGVTLDNATQGILYFIVPKFEKLLDIQTWRAAAEQMFFSLGVAFGTLTMLGSYNKFNNNCYRDGLIVSVLDSATSVISGLAMFSILGYLAGQMDVGIENVVDSGPGLAFVTFPDAVTTMPVPALWSLLFFIMLFTLGLGSEIALLENSLTYLCDRFPQLRAKRPLVTLAAVVLCFLIDIPFVTQGGYELFEVFDKYAGGLAVLIVAAAEVLCIMWVYGLKRFLNDLQEMLGKTGNLGWYWRTAWLILAPVTLLFITIVSITSFELMSQPGVNNIPPWADGIGWSLTALAVVQLPLWAAIVLYKAPGNTFGEKFHQSLWPDTIVNPRSSKMEMNQNGISTNGNYLGPDQKILSSYDNQAFHRD